MGHWIIDTATIGSLIAAGVGLAVLLAYGMMLRWIAAAPRQDGQPEHRVE
jgi:hypothetical protein